MAQVSENTDKVFIDELFLTEYLGAMLKTSPPMDLDLPPAWVTAQEPTAFSSANNFSRRNESSQAEQLALIETLRRENEHLKFSSELTKIDIEVLRGENQKLQGELSGLKGDLSNAQKILNEQQAHNKSLKEELAPLRIQIKTLQVELQARQEQHANQTDSFLLPPLRQIDNPETAAPNSTIVEKTASSPPQQLISPDYRERALISTEERRIVLGNQPDDRPQIQHRTETSVLSASPKNNDTYRAESKRKLEIIAQGAAKNSRKRKPFEPGSKIVKPTESQLQMVMTGKNYSAQNILIPAQLPAQELHGAPVTNTTETAVPHDKNKTALNSDEIKLDSVPASKATKRKNADNYIQMQQDAEESSLSKGYSITVS